MTPLRRHQLVWLKASAWEATLAWAAEHEAAALSAPSRAVGLAYWAAHDLPLVVTRQACDGAGAMTSLPANFGRSLVLALGLPLPNAWGRNRIRVDVRADAIRARGAFPSMAEIAAQLPETVDARWAVLGSALVALGVKTAVYGSHGWQRLTGLSYLREGSDIDLLIEVSNPAQADAVAGALKASGIESPRLDGELVFPDGSAVAWREWAIWRAGLVAQVLIKRLDGPLLVDRSHEAHWVSAGWPAAMFSPQRTERRVTP